MSSTRKKVKIVGTEKYINQTTGALEEMQVISIEERDANFHKIWLDYVIHSLDIIGNQKIRFTFWLLEQMNNENQILMTLRQMSEKSKISLFTVRQTVKTLKKENFLISYNTGVYQVNPDMIFKGGKNERMNILIEYKNTTEEKKKGKK